MDKKDDSLIHLRVPAKKKAEWVRESRAEGQKLTDWIVDRIEAKDLPIADALREAADLARSLEDTPIFHRNRLCADGIITIQQQAARYDAARDTETRADAALWAREGYQLLSAGLTDTHAGLAPNERETGWATASQIARIFGGEEIWKKRAEKEFGGID